MRLALRILWLALALSGAALGASHNDLTTQVAPR